MDLQGFEITQLEAEQLRHPAVAGVILFARNYKNKAQLVKLTKAIRAVNPDIVIGVDHEGGRVQRFVDGFSKIPAMASFIEQARDLQQAKQWAELIGYLMAVELQQVGIDFSFAPVLDRNGISDVIGRRAFSADPQIVTELAQSLINGFHHAGMIAIGKHFPGHGGVKADSHVAIAQDPRSFSEIEQQELPPFMTLIKQGVLQGIMPAHVIYTRIDPNPAGFSPYWLQQVLKQQLNFSGSIFSDDLSMHGATVVGDISDRVYAALSAGCDFALVCNSPTEVAYLLQHYQWQQHKVSHIEPLKAANLYAADFDQVMLDKAKLICQQLN